MTPEQEAKLVEDIARAMHDGPLCAGDHDFDGKDKQEIASRKWCVEMAIVALAVARPVIRDELLEEFAGIADFCLHNEPDFKGLTADDLRAMKGESK